MVEKTLLIYKNNLDTSVSPSPHPLTNLSLGHPWCLNWV
jgi:hypothetical protein